MTKYHSVLIDGDIIINKASFAIESSYYESLTHPGIMFNSKKELNIYLKANPEAKYLKVRDVLPIASAYSIVDNLIRTISHTLQCDNTVIVVGPASGSKIFRHKKYPEYKANRSSGDRPLSLDAVRTYIINNFSATIAEDMEADDLLGIMQCNQKGSIIASIDKDLLQIPGHHYNIDRKEVIVSSDPGSLEIKRSKSNALALTGVGFKWFAAQMLLGDKVDNIPKPKKGLGPRKVFDLLNPKKTNEEMWDLIEEIYQESDLDLDTNAMLLWILRDTNKDWRHLLCK